MPVLPFLTLMFQKHKTFSGREGEHDSPMGSIFSVCSLGHVFSPGGYTTSLGLSQAKIMLCF